MHDVYTYIDIIFVSPQLIQCHHSWYRKFCVFLMITETNNNKEDQIMDQNLINDDFGF